MQTLRKIISKYMYRIVGISALGMLVMILLFQVLHEQNVAYRDAERTFMQMEQVLEENQEELIRLKEEYNHLCLHAAEMASHFIEEHPEVLDSPDKLKLIAAEVEADEIHVFDEEGTIFAGTLPQYYGYTFDSGEQMNFFKPMLADKSLKLVQDITANTAEGKMMQYSAVWSSGGKFIVQVGMNPDNVLEVTEKNELSHIFSLFRVNPNVSYYAMDEENGTIVGSNDLESVGKKCSDAGFRFGDIKDAGKGFYSKINGRYSFCIFQKIGDNYIGRVVSIRYLYQSIPLAMAMTFICLMVVSILLVIAVMKYLDRYVVNKIHDVIEKLELIAKGNLEERIDVQGSVEFQELSTFINQMVQSLLKTRDAEQKVNEALRVALQAGNPESSLKIMLECLGTAMGGTRTYIFERNELGGGDNTYEWVADGTMPERDNLQNIPAEICEGWYSGFSENRREVFESLADMGEESFLRYKNQKNQNTASIVIVPLNDDGDVICCEL